MNAPATGASGASACRLCQVADPEYAEGMCDEYDHVEERIVLAVALAEAVNPSEEPQEHAWRALSFLDDDVLRIMADLGPQTEWSVQSGGDLFEGATINGVQFVMVPDEANGRLHPAFPDGLACPVCGHALDQLHATWMDENYRAGTVEIECDECYEVVTVPVWWPRASAPSAEPEAGR